MDPLDDLELRVLEITGNPEDAMRAREFIADAATRGIIGWCEILDLTIELENNDK